MEPFVVKHYTDDDRPTITTARLRHLIDSLPLNTNPQWAVGSDALSPEDRQQEPHSTLDSPDQ